MSDTAPRTKSERPATPLRLAVIVVSYNVCHLLQRCLTALEREKGTSGTFKLTVHVVDNASHDGSAAMVQKNFPWVELTALDQNLGFTGGNNLVLQRWLIPGPAEPDLILLLNPDAEPLPGTLETMCTFMRDLPQVGACGGRLQYGDGTFQHGAFHFPDLSQTLIDLAPLHTVPLLRRFSGRLGASRLNGRYPRSSWEGTEPFEVDFVLGAALMLRVSALQAIGPLDDEFFMYCEEIDWAMRLRHLGQRLYALPQAHFIHHEARSSRQANWLSFQRLWRSRIRLFNKHSDRYSANFRRTLKIAAPILFRIRSRQALQRFARGIEDGSRIGSEVAAYAKVEQMFRSELS